MTVADGRKPRTTVSLTQVRTYVDALDRDVTTGDVMTQFNISRSQARTHLNTLAEEGLLTKEGNGGGAKYRKLNRRALPPIEPGNNGNGNGKPIVPATREEIRSSLLGKLASDCDRELERLDGEIGEAERTITEAEQRMAALSQDRAKIAKAREAFGA